MRTEPRCYQNYFKLGLIGMAVTSIEKGWLDVNDKLCEILGYSRDTLLTLSWTDITHPDDLSADVAEFEKVLAGETEGYAIDKRFIRQDGTTISANCIRKDDGGIDHFVAFVQDITERKYTEIKLQIMNTDLESLVAQRTAELEEANRQLQLSSDTDFLTKIFNRRFYERRLVENISTAIRNDTYLSLLVIDVDNFKAYNDHYGHDKGDATLCQVANTIKETLHRDTDLVARYGGEEFVVLLPATNAEGALAIAEKIRNKVETLDIEHSQSASNNVTVSIGVESMAADTLNENELFKHADMALYKAKRKGKNCSYLHE